jgi:hypothetical protein
MTFYPPALGGGSYAERRLRPAGKESRQEGERYPRLRYGKAAWILLQPFRALCLSACPLFDRPKRGRKKPHQPALAHCVRVAGLDALRLRALPPPGPQTARARRVIPWTRFAQTSICDTGPEVIPLRCPSASHHRPRRRTAKGPENGLAWSGFDDSPTCSPKILLTPSCDRYQRLSF